MKQVELLAPVGKFENALAAIENGANAIFVGGKVFNARQFADNFDEDELGKIVNYCKLRGVKTHITVNTLIKEEELGALMDYLASLARFGVDAVIVQDLGVAELIKRYFPQIELHASTQ
ncbi:MAG: peptidase U32 family protein, partial [Niameybacter sp.]